MFNLSSCHQPHAYKKDGGGKGIHIGRPTVPQGKQLINLIDKTKAEEEKKHTKGYFPARDTRDWMEGFSFPFLYPKIPAVDAHDKVIGIDQHIPYQAPFQQKIYKESGRNHAGWINRNLVLFGIPDTG